MRGITVVRPGESVPASEHGAYMLIDRDDLIVRTAIASQAGTLLRRCRLCRVDLVDERGPAYREQLEVDDHQRVIRLSRRYQPERRPAGAVLLTEDIALARNWSHATDATQGSIDVRRRVMVHEYARDTRAGMIWRADALDGARRVLPELLPDLPAAHTDQQIIEHAPGIWRHESSTVHANARLIGPMWIGRDVVVNADAFIIGPVILTDADDDAATTPIALSADAVPTASYEPPIEPTGEFGKRLFDIVFSLVALGITLPIYPILMLLIMLEDGRPFFFKHRRQSRAGREFTCLKFRTMCRDAEAMKRELATENASDGPQFHVRNDPRVLRCGRWMRTLHIDEWPQFWNILCGDMSVVGPRPSPDRENQFCPTWREARLSVRPGLTGLWQVKRTREPLTDFEEWIRFDLAYIHQRSWRMDLWIIAQTIRTVLRPSSH